MGRQPRISAEPTSALALGAHRPPPNYVWDELGGPHSTWECTRILNSHYQVENKDLKATRRE